MQLLNVAIVLMIGAISTVAVDASSITIRQTANRQVAFEVTYQLYGRTMNESSGYFSIGKERTIDIPAKATEILLIVCGTWDKYCRDQIFTKFFSSPPTKCFTLTGGDQYTEDPYCQKVPAGGYSISVHQGGGDFKASFEVTYQLNGSKSSSSSGEITRGQNKTVAIPTAATNVTCVVQVYRMSLSKDTLFTKFYPLPVKKCFVTAGDGFFEKRWFEKPCEKLPSVNGNSVRVRQTLSNKVQMQLVYNYEGSELTEFSEFFSKGQSKTLQIPDAATDIKVNVLKEERMGKQDVLISQSYPSPVKKCLKVEGFSSLSPKITEEGC